MEAIVLINITGPDRPGLNACFAGILARYDVRVLDIGQSVIHEHISLGILAAIPCKEDFSAVFKDMLFEGYQLGLKVDIRPVVPDSYENWVHAQGKERRIITILGPAISARQIAAVSSVCAEQGLNIHSITRLTGRISLEHPQPRPRASIQFSVSGTPKQIGQMRGRFMDISRATGVDISFHVDNIYQKNRKLVVFDMDSTLIQSEVIVELARLAGAGPQAEQITRSAMQGEMDFKESFRRRVALLKGLTQTDLDQILQSLPLTEGPNWSRPRSSAWATNWGSCPAGLRLWGTISRKSWDLTTCTPMNWTWKTGWSPGGSKARSWTVRKRPPCSGKSPRRKTCPSSRPLPSGTGPMICP